jgi:hypothetical protein
MSWSSTAFAPGADVILAFARTWDWPRTRRYDDLSNDPDPSSPRQFCPDYIIATPGYDFQEGQAQIEGGIIFGITAALYGQITLKNGRVEQSNFDNYRMLRINEAPVVEVHIIKSTEAPGGIGEPGTAAVFPAATNAIFAATGKRIRKLPVNPSELRSV